MRHGFYWSRIDRSMKGPGTGRGGAGQPALHQRGLLDSTDRDALARPAAGRRGLEQHPPLFHPLAGQEYLGKAA